MRIVTMKILLFYTSFFQPYKYLYNIVQHHVKDFVSLFFINTLMI